MIREDIAALINKQRYEDAQEVLKAMIESRDAQEKTIEHDPNPAVSGQE